jgi:hypothetical protein
MIPQVEPGVQRLAIDRDDVAFRRLPAFIELVHAGGA